MQFVFSCPPFKLFLAQWYSLLNLPNILSTHTRLVSAVRQLDERGQAERESEDLDGSYQ